MHLSNIFAIEVRRNLYCFLRIGRPGRLLRSIGLPLAIGLFFFVTANARPGDIDRGFGNNGILATPHVNISSFGRPFLMPNGKIIFVGAVAGDFYVARFNASGSLDTTFDGDGELTIPVSPRDDAASSAYVQLDGKIVICGSSRSTNSFYDFAIVRLNDNGTLDGSLDEDGIRITPISSSDDFARSVVVQSDGKIVVAGQAFSNRMNIAVVRYNTDGSFDNTFDADGITIAQFQEGASTSSEVAIAGDGKIVVAGTVGVGGQFLNATFGAARFQTNGTLDNTFGGDGTVFADVRIGPAQQNSGERLLIQPNNKVIVAGYTNSGLGTGFDFAVLRLNTDGARDDTFGTGGQVITPIANGDDFVRSVALQADGKLLVGGNGRVNSANGFALVRYRSDGSPDPQFGKLGISFVPDDTGGISVLSLQNDNLIGAFSFDSQNAKFLKFFQFGYFQSDFDADAKTDLGIFRPSVEEWWINRSSSGTTFAVQFGSAADDIVPVDFTGDGKTDIAVWRPSTGEWFVLRSEDLSFYAFPFGTDGDIPAPADFDGDGKSDPTVFRPATGLWFILTAGGAVRTEQFGRDNDVPLTGDYDGDGKADVAIFRPSSSEWWINRSRAGIIAMEFGTSTDKAAPGDYTGDGKTDVAFWRPSTGAWFVLRSEDLSFYSAPFGASTDIAAPGDYDGDGRYDFTVFRPSNATWFSQRTTAGILIQQFGATGDTPVANAFVR